MWHEHELGNYATVGLHSNPGEIEDAPWEYINRAAKAVSRFDAVDWSELPGEDEDRNEQEEEQDEEDADANP